MRLNTPKETDSYHRPFSIGSWRRIASLCLLASASTLAQDIEYATLPGLIQSGSQAFASGYFTEAAQAFGKVESIYSEDQAWKSGSLPRKLLPLTGFAALKAGRFEQSVNAFESFLHEYADNYSQQTFAEYSLAISLKQQGQIPEAIQAFQQFRENSRSPSQQAIAALIEATLLFEHGQEKAGEDLLIEMMQGQRSERVRTQARLSLILRYLDTSDYDMATERLLERAWSVESMPEIAVLSHIAMNLGERLLESQKPEAALRAFKLCLSPSDLKRRQQQKIDELEARFERKRHSLGMEASIWTDFYTRLINGLNSQLKALEAVGDYQEAHQFKIGQCYLDSKRPFEAWLVFEKLSQSSDKAIAKNAHFQWLLSARDCRRLGEAIKIANRFRHRYPNSPDTDKVVYLVAATQIEQEWYKEASHTLESLLESNRPLPFEAAALFQLGYCHYQLNELGLAQKSYRSILENHPESPLSGRAAVWIGLCIFREGHYSKALQHYRSIVSNPRWTETHPEASYRSQTCLFALGRYTEALDEIGRFNRNYPNSERSFDAQSLLGDLKIVQQEYEEAIGAFNGIPQELPAQYLHARMQIAQAHVAMGRHQKAITTLRRFTSIDSDPHSLAAYRLLLTLQMQYEGERQARKTVDLALNKFGESKTAEGILPLLADFHSLVGSIDYITYLDTNINNQPSPTLKAYLSIAKALALRNTGRPHQCEELLLQTAGNSNLDTLPTVALAHLGLQLVEIASPEGETMLNRLVSTYPSSNLSPIAYFGLAHANQRKRQPQLALAWIGRIGDSHFDSEIYIPAKLLQSELAQKQGDPTQSIEISESVLALKWATPEQKAKALTNIAQCKAYQNKAKEAIAYYQRIYMLYPAYEDISASSYVESARLLLSLDNIEGAILTCQELLAQERFSESEAFNQARELLDSLSALEATRAAATNES